MSFVYKNLTSVVPIGGVSTLTGNSGGAVGPAAGNINVVGSGLITVAGNPGTSTLTISSSGGSSFTWNDQTTSTTMAVNNGYVADSGSLVTLTLPATAVFGSVIQVAGKGAGLWSIAQNSGQVIHFGTSSTTSGATGSLSAINQYDCVSLVCITANTDFVVTSVIGNLTVV